MTASSEDDNEVPSVEPALTTQKVGLIVPRSGVYQRFAGESERSLEEVVRHAREAGARADAAHAGAGLALAESHAAREQVRPAPEPDEERMRRLRERIHHWHRALRERNGDDD